jgi:hypothetical protein
MVLTLKLKGLVIMKNLIVFGLLTMLLSNCGNDQPSKRTVSKPVSLTNPVVTVTADEVTPFAATGIPDSYTFLDTPDANLCVDAFLRKGITLPADTVARTLDAHSFKSDGIAISDIETSSVSILNVVHIRSDFSNMMFQFYNRKGFYCIVKNTSNFSNIRIQRSCDSQMAEVEPIMHDSHGSSLNLFWWFQPRTQDNPDATTGTYNSKLTEMPCIP